jgi:hypothetical protein
LVCSQSITACAIDEINCPFRKALTIRKPCCGTLSRSAKSTCWARLPDGGQTSASGSNKSGSAGSEHCYRTGGEAAQIWRLSSKLCSEEDMEEVRGKHVSPTIDQLAFNCPHCHALARQFWFSVHADPLKADEKPVVANGETVAAPMFGDAEEGEREREVKWMPSGRPFLRVHREFRNRDVQNISISYCFNCNEICLWVVDQMVWPGCATGPEPKLHASPHVRRETEEASPTLDASPRGAAALLRLAMEKLCKELSDSEESPRPEIAPLFQDEVDARVQKVLDAMRIIESNAIPPDHVGVGDTRATAETLSGLVNLICEKMIIEPRHLQALYAKVRDDAQSALEQRAQGSS